MANKKKFTEEEKQNLQKKRKAVLEHERQEDWNIHRRLYEIMREVWYIERYTEGESPYSTVEHDDVTRSIRPSFIKHGVYYHISDLKNREVILFDQEKYDYKKKDMKMEKNFLLMTEFNVNFVNVDNPEDKLIVPAFALSSDANAMTLSGKNQSYGIKMAILKTLNLETGDTEDVGEQLAEADENAVAIYNMLGQDLFGEKWDKDKIGKRKIYEITNHKTADASRAPTWALNEAIKNMYELKEKKEKNPDKDIQDIDKETKKENNPASDIMSDFDEE